MDELVTCAVCLDRFNQPKLLPCQHTFCLSPCLEGLVKNERIDCPECRAVHVVPSSGVSGFPNNLTMVKLMDVPTPSKSSVGQSCQECKAVNVMFGKCLHCNESLCRQCLTKHTNILKNHLKDSVSKVSRRSSDISQKIFHVQQLQETLKKNEQKLTEEIEKWYHRCVSEFQLKKDKFIQSVKTFTSQETGVLEGKHESLEMELALMNRLCENAARHNKRSSLTDSIDKEQKPLIEMLEESKNHLEKPIEEITTEKFAKFCDMKANSIVKIISELQGIEIHNRPVTLTEEELATMRPMHVCRIEPNNEGKPAEELPTTSSSNQQERVGLSMASMQETLSMESDSLIIEGNQPPGQMDCRHLDSPLPGHENHLYFSSEKKTLEIMYKFPGGCLNGVKYARKEFKAYIPAISLFRNALPRRLEKAFKAGAIFKLRYERGETTGEIVWGDIPHKTNKIGGPDDNGYPDDGYLKRLDEALNAKGFSQLRLFLRKR